jgi:hypothetical protein
MRPALQAHLFIVMVGLVLGGCVSWRPYEAGLSLDANRPLPTRLRATGQDSTRVLLTAPFVRGDTLYGRVQGDTVGIPVAEISGLEWERLSADRTLGLVIAVPAALGLIYLVKCDDGQCRPVY